MPYFEYAWESKGEDEVVFEVLRRWNSFSPLVSDSRGGGYFLKAFGRGIIIDPGHSFIRNFRDAGHHFADINHVFMTHTHSDHTGDFEFLLNLLFEYNDCLENYHIPIFIGKSFHMGLNDIQKEGSETYSRAKVIIRKIFEKKQHKIAIHMPRTVRHKYIGIIKHEPQIVRKKTCEIKKIKYPGNFDDIKTLDDFKDRCFIKSNSVDKIYSLVIKAIHKELYCGKVGYRPGEVSTFGYCIYVEQRNTVLVITGDTAWTDGTTDLSSQYKAIRQLFEKQNIVLVAHVGSLKEYESKNKFYEQHLGRLGLMEVIISLQPDLCLISEFGEEFSSLRPAFANVVKRSLRPVIKSFPRLKNLVVLPADDHLVMRLENKEMKNPISIKVITGIDTSRRLIRMDYVCITRVGVAELQGTGYLFYYDKEAGLSENLIAEAILRQYANFDLSNHFEKAIQVSKKEHK